MALLTPARLGPARPPRPVADPVPAGRRRRRPHHLDHPSRSRNWLWTDWRNGGKGGTYGPRELRVALPTLVDALRPAGPGPR
ncbi:hypothetical protein C0Q95_19590 [Streptomyces albidoflavus]|nr:hypothetical protein C0Q95_19590 [Streptomyces albidoflavus]